MSLLGQISSFLMHIWCFLASICTIFYVSLSPDRCLFLVKNRCNGWFSFIGIGSVFLRDIICTFGYLYIQIVLYFVQKMLLSCNNSPITPVSFPSFDFPCVAAKKRIFAFLSLALDSCLICPFFFPIIHLGIHLFKCSWSTQNPHWLYPFCLPPKVQIGRLFTCQFLFFLPLQKFRPKSFHKIFWVYFTLVAYIADITLFSPTYHWRLSSSADALPFSSSAGSLK